LGVSIVYIQVEKIKSRAQWLCFNPQISPGCSSPSPLVEPSSHRQTPRTRHREPLEPLSNPFHRLRTRFVVFDPAWLSSNLFRCLPTHSPSSNPSSCYRTRLVIANPSRRFQTHLAVVEPILPLSNLALHFIIVVVALVVSLSCGSPLCFRGGGPGRRHRRVALLFVVVVVALAVVVIVRHSYSFSHPHRRLLFVLVVMALLADVSPTPPLRRFPPLLLKPCSSARMVLAVASPLPLPPVVSSLRHFPPSLLPPSSLHRFPSPRFHSPPPPRFHVLSAFLILLESPHHHRVPLPRRYAIPDSPALGLTRRSWHVGDPSFVIVIVERGMAVLVICPVILTPPSNDERRPHPSGEGRGNCGWDPYCGCWGVGG